MSRWLGLSIFISVAQGTCIAGDAACSLKSGSAPHSSMLQTRSALSLAESVNVTSLSPYGKRLVTFRQRCAQGGLAKAQGCGYFRTSSLVRATTAAPPSELLARTTGTNGIVVASVCIPGNEDWSRICNVARINFQKYCNRHGYQLQFRTERTQKERGLAWEKILLLQEVLKDRNVRFVFWMDADSLFMTSAPLDPIFPSGPTDMSISTDANGINTGHFALRNTEWSNNFLKDVWQVYPPPKPTWFWEQSSIMYILSGQKAECRQEVTEACRFETPIQVDMKPQKAMNQEWWSPGDLVQHFAGRSDSQKAHAMEFFSAFDPEKQDLWMPI